MRVSVFIWTQYHCQILLAPLSWPQIQNWMNSLQSGICVGSDFRGAPQRFGLCFSVSRRRRNTSFGTPSALCKHWPLTISDRFWQANGPTCKISLTHLHTSPLGHGTFDIIPTALRDIYGPQQRWDYLLPPLLPVCVLRHVRPPWIFLPGLKENTSQSINRNTDDSVLRLIEWCHWPVTTLEVFKDFCTRHSNHGNIWSIHS